MYTLAGVVNCQTGLLVVNKAMQVQCRDIRIVFGMGRHWIGSDMVKCVGEVYSGQVLQILVIAPK